MFICVRLLGQIQPVENWPKSIKYDLNKLKEAGIDTFLVYYLEIGPWSNLPDSCNEVPSVWFLWQKNGSYFVKKSICDSIKSNEAKQMSSVPINYFTKHITEFKNELEKRQLYLKQHIFLPPIPTDGEWEHLIFMTPQTNIQLGLSGHQRPENYYGINWKSFSWIDPTIKAIDTIKYELFHHKN